METIFLFLKGSTLIRLYELLTVIKKQKVALWLNLSLLIDKRKTEV
jgi:hypothetical protein